MAHGLAPGCGHDPADAHQHLAAVPHLGLASRHRGVTERLTVIFQDHNSQSSHQRALTAHDPLCRGVLGKKVIFIDTKVLNLETVSS